MLIKADNISLKIGEQVIFSNINFDIEKPQMVAITGASGSGKTSLLNCCGLIKELSSGNLFINGEDCTNLSEKEKLSFWKNSAAFIYQDYGIIDEENIIYNITFSNSRFDKNRLEECLQKVGLIDKIDSKALVLSGGEKQRLGIARALYKKASIIFADEPTASLDEDNKNIIFNLFQECVRMGALVLLATHDEKLSKVCDKIISMGYA